MMRARRSDTIRSTITPACGGNPLIPNHIAGQQDLKEGFALHCSGPLASD
jgi:hypothetical protein